MVLAFNSGGDFAKAVYGDSSAQHAGTNGGIATANPSVMTGGRRRRQRQSQRQQRQQRQRAGQSQRRSQRQRQSQRRRRQSQRQQQQRGGK